MFEKGQKLPFANLPTALLYYMNSITNFKRNRYVRSVGSPSQEYPASSSFTCKFNNGFIDKPTFAIHSEGTTLSANNTFCKFPQYSGSLIESYITKSAGGTIDESTSGMNLLYNLIADTHMSASALTKKNVLEQGWGVGPLAKQNIAIKTAGDGSMTIDQANTTLAQTKVTSNDTAKPIVMKNFLGFWGSTSPQILATPILSNDLELTIKLAGPEILVGSGEGVNNQCTYSLKNIKFSVDMISFEDNNYLNSIEELVEKGAEFHIGYTSYRNFIQSFDTMTFSQNINFAADSVDYLWHSFYSAKAQRGQADVNKAVTVTTLDGSQYLKPAALVRSCQGLRDVRVRFNSTYIPQDAIVQEELMDVLENTLETSTDVDHGMSPFINSLDTFLSTFYVLAVSFCMQGGDGRTSSGLSTKGSGSYFDLICTGDGTVRDRFISNVWLQMTTKIISRYNTFRVII